MSWPPILVAAPRMPRVPLPSPRHYRLSASRSLFKPLPGDRSGLIRGAIQGSRAARRQENHMTPTIAVIAAGAMGSAIAARLTRHGATVLTSLEGRGAKSRARAEAAGMQHVDDQRLVEEASMILSIVPPAEAGTLAERFAARLGGSAHAPILLDFNPLSGLTLVSLRHSL